jgi:ABC-type nitrate/sulfonate/bicarbonate transport system substrate-binding protein
VLKLQPARRQRLRIGFTALVDAAPLIMAQELALFKKFEVEIILSRELGWATIRDKIVYGELDAAHAPAGLLVALQCGIGTVQTDCLTGLVLNLHGNAITLSQRLWKRGIRSGHELREEIARGDQPPAFGIVYPHSSHAILLRQWLRSHGISPDRDVKLVVVPPAQMHANLRAGHLLGYCVGEPWNSMAVLSRTGWVTATSAELAPGHPEKVLMVRRQFADEHEEEHLRVIAALSEACRFCDEPQNRERLVETLAASHFLNAPVEAVRMSLGGAYNYGNDRIEKTGGQHVFYSGGANEPTLQKAEWLIDNLISSGAVPDATFISSECARQCFRADLFREATELIQS